MTCASFVVSSAATRMSYATPPTVKVSSDVVFCSTGLQNVRPACMSWLTVEAGAGEKFAATRLKPWAPMPPKAPNGTV